MMSHLWKNHSLVQRWMVAGLMLVILSSCSKDVATVKSESAMESQWPEPFQDAIRDAMNPEPGKIVDNLTAITADNKKLVWKKIGEVDHVLMVAFVANQSRYERSVGKSYDTRNIEIWVTAVPEVSQLCTEMAPTEADLTMRLRQLLGLPPTISRDGFVELWVDPYDLFRPAADNEITDTTAGLDLPKDITSEYRTWFNEQRASRYFQSKEPVNQAYPWTRLGYTYDWGSFCDKQGISEFVIRKQSTVVVNKTATINAYCDN